MLINNGAIASLLLVDCAPLPSDNMCQMGVGTVIAVLLLHMSSRGLFLRDSGSGFAKRWALGGRMPCRWDPRGK